MNGENQLLEHRQWVSVRCAHQRSFDGPLGQCGPMAWGGVGQVPQHNTRYAIPVTIPKATLA